MTKINQSMVVNGAIHESALEEREITRPVYGGYRDRTGYRAVHFFGASLHETLFSASIYLRRLEEDLGYPPHILSVHDELSSADAGTDLMWKFTVVLGEPD